MQIETGYLYHIKDNYFEKINDNSLMINHKKGHSRPSYLAIKENDILWFIPLSSKVYKYQKIVENKIKKYGSCKTILIKKIAGKEQVVLIQNAFPTVAKYIQSGHTINGKYVKVSSFIKREIIDDFQYMLSLKENGLNLFFTDIDKIKSIMLEELNLDFNFDKENKFDAKIKTNTYDKDKSKMIENVKDKLDNDKSIERLITQINTFYKYKDSFKLPKHSYKVGDKILLSKGTLLHGTYKNIEGLKEIIKDGLISSWFIDGRGSKYPSSVGVWNLKQDYYLKDYINLYSGGSVRLYNHLDDKKNKTFLIKYDELNDIKDIITNNGYLVWKMEQTKEARFLPSLVQDKVQIGIIFNGNSREIKELLKGDILNVDNINDIDVKEFVNPDYYDKFIRDRKCKDDFFTDRENAIVFGIPPCFIEGILVGRIYERDVNILNEIKKLLPNCYICNLDGIVIRE